MKNENSRRIVGFIFLGLGLLAAAAWVSSSENRGLAGRLPPTGVIRPQDLADSLHLIIAADREMYSRWIVQRLAEEKKVINACADWARRDCLPAPDQMLRLAAESIQTKGAEFNYGVRALNPIDPRNAPQTDAELAGLKYVSAHPDRNYYRQETLGGRRYFTAIYPDAAIVSGCVNCHTRRSDSSGRTLRVGDVVGAIVVRVALEF